MDRVLDLYRSGLSARAVAARAGIPEARVFRLIHEAGIARRPGTRHLSPELKADVRLHLAAGIPAETTARLTGASASSVRLLRDAVRDCSARDCERDTTAAAPICPEHRPTFERSE